VTFVKSIHGGGVKYFRRGVELGHNTFRAVAFFASDASRWVTGQTLDVNGGLYLGRKVAG
jgi:NAD(P)-dependent dehydrogenase (short-subunit alcohol dehydrogenase family)